MFVFRVTEIVNRDVKPQIKITQVFVVTSWFHSSIYIPLIGKDGDDVIDKLPVDSRVQSQ